tara:strand:+ start:271 stop:633 length:363 start_codon:yes stop_codon:yes gene_type:complete
MHPSGASRNREDQAIFSKDGPYLISPALTNNPRVIPNKYKLKNNKSSGNPKFKIEIPKSGAVNKIAGTSPIRVRIKAVKMSEVIISFNFRGAINKFVKFLLHISSKKSILKLMLDLKRIS